MRGIFVVLEGTDGCGKSTQARRLLERLEALGRHPLHVREPGGTPAGERIRALLLDPELGEIAPVTEVLLYQASRAQLVREVLEPTLAEGRDVVCERWHYATWAYQGAASGAGPAAVDATSPLATGGLEPDRAVLLDISDAVADARLGEELDRIEQRGLLYRAKVAQALRQRFAAGGASLRIVSAEGPEAAVGERVWESLRDLFGA